MVVGPDSLGIVAGCLALCALLVFLSAVLTARRAQRAAYYSTRRQLSRTANRQLGVSLIMLLTAGLTWVTSLLLPRPPAATVTTTTAAVTPLAMSPTVLQTTTSISTPTALPPTAMIAPSPTPRPAPTPEPTSSPLARPPDAPAPMPAQPAPDERLALVAIASGVSADGAPVGVTTSFSKETSAIYVFFSYQDVPPSALLRHAWFRDGGSVFFGSKRLPANGRGSDYIAWSPPDGFQPGLYEVRVSLGGVLQFVANFEVR